MNAPLGMIPMHEEKQAVAAIQPLRFWIKYRPIMEYTVVGAKTIEKETDKLQAEEWVEWAKKGVTIPATTVQKVSRIQKAAAKATEADDEAAAIWRTMKPFYDNWKNGGDSEAVISGTPLAIWPGITRDVVEALKPFKIYSVEDLSIASDGVLHRVPDPNIMRYRDRAKKYLNTKDIALAVRDIDQKDQELAALRDQVAALQKAHADAAKGRKDAEDELDEATPAVARKRRVKAEAA